MAIGPLGSWQALARLLAGRRATLSLIIAGSTMPMHDGYAPSDGDRMILESPLQADAVDALQLEIRRIADEYRAQALTSLRTRGDKPTTGRLTVSANLPPNTQITAVTFLLDSVPVALLNRPPFRVVWDTRDWQDGEHLVEVRALDARGICLTRSKRLVFVANAG
jgi:hypothetical protein